MRKKNSFLTEMVGYFMPLLPNKKIMFSLQTAHQALSTHSLWSTDSFTRWLPHTRHMNMQRCLIYALNTHSGGQWEWCRGVIEENTTRTYGDAVTSLEFEQKTDEARGPGRLQMEKIEWNYCLVNHYLGSSVFS